MLDSCHLLASGLAVELSLVKPDRTSGSCDAERMKPPADLRRDCLDWWRYRCPSGTWSSGCRARTGYPGQLSLAIPSWVGAMSTSQRAVMPCGWGVKASMVRVWVAGKAVWSPCYTRAISERFRDKELTIKRYINSPFLLSFARSDVSGYCDGRRVFRPSCPPVDLTRWCNCFGDPLTSKLSFTVNRNEAVSPRLITALRYLFYQRVIWGISITQIFPFQCL